MRLRLAAVVAAAVAASVLAVPAAAVEWVQEQAYIPTKHGEVFVDYSRPKTGKAPVILSITPFRWYYVQADAEANRDDFYSARYQPLGYARAFADLIGFGLSEGCWDYGGLAEAEANAEVIEWFGTRPWSNGKVGMIGSTYDGSVQLAVATLAPKHLAAIVPQEPVSSWYHYSYERGVSRVSAEPEYLQDNYLPEPADQYVALAAIPSHDLDHVSPASAQRTAADGSRCETAEHAARAHARPGHDAFWAERDWSRRAHQVKAAVLFQHGWRNTNYTHPDQFTRYWQNLTNAADRRAILGQWRVGDVFAAPTDTYALPLTVVSYLDAFFARHLMGKRDAALDRMPKVVSQASDSWYRASLPLGAPKTAFPLDRPMGAGTGTFVTTGTESRATVAHDPEEQLGFASYAFPVTRDTRLAGAGEATLRLTSSLPRGQAAVTLLDVPPGDAAPVVVTTGMLDLRYRDSLTAPKDVPAGTPFQAKVTLLPQDYILKKGHRLVVAVAGCDTVAGVPDPLAGQRYTVLPGSVLRLPLVGTGGVLS